jgi:hypothetical protein
MSIATKTIRWLMSLTIAIISTSACLGDGVVFRGDYRSMFPIVQNEQHAVILHSQGREKLLIAISLDMENEDNAIWIFPVPGKPQEVEVNVLDLFPRFYGKDPRVEAYRFLTGVRDLSLLTQIYPLFTCCFMSALSANREAGIFIHGTIEKWGIRAETITAKSAVDLSEYFKEKKAGLDANELKLFERYLAGDYVLVVAWIESRAELLKQFPGYQSGKTSDLGRWPCLYVEFPSERAFYPLLATSFYGDKRIPIDVVAIGYFAPDVNGKLKDSFWPRYYKQSVKPEKIPAQLTDSIPDKNISYTRFRFRGLAKDLTDDLWLIPTVPAGMGFAEAILEASDNPLFLFGPILCYIAIVSYVSAGFAGLILYRKWRGFDLLGFCNVFTIVAMYFTARWAKDLFAVQIKNANRKFSIAKFLTVFSAVFVLLNYLLPFLIGIIFLNYAI